MEELQVIIKKMQESFNGSPWYGKSILKVFEEVDASSVYTQTQEACAFYDRTAVSHADLANFYT